MKRPGTKTAIVIIASIQLTGCGGETDRVKPAQDIHDKPNVVVIVADDLGYSDLGVFGSEIRTPNLDDLAGAGRIFTEFYTSPTCSPSRATLLTGVDHHRAGLGAMHGIWDTNQQGQPGYEGHLNKDVVTVVSLLRDSGYHTYMAGKWHLGLTDDTGPHSRGFERSFALVEGGASHFGDAAAVVERLKHATYRENGQIAELPADFYSSAFYTDKIIEYIDEQIDDGHPFLAYAAYTAPHWPLQAPDDYLDRYSGEYDQGYDVLAKQRSESVRRLGFFPDIAPPARPLPHTPAWEHLDAEEKRIESRKMEIYAAMVENLDHHIGRIVEYLKTEGEYDNSVFIFMSDNGPEGNDIANLATNREWIPKRFNNAFDNMGRMNSYVYSGPGWAQASAAPFSGYKSFPMEGGIRSPAFITYPGKIDSGVTNATALVADITPTILELAGVPGPGTEYAGRPVARISGRSLTPLLIDNETQIYSAEDPLGWELFGRRALRRGQWKITWLGPPNGDGEWRLYDLSTDPGEVTDLSAMHPEKVKALASLWNEYARQNNVILPSRDTGYGNPRE